MVHLSMDHPASGCFGTNLASKKLTLVEIVNLIVIA
jgi:hypothetical protein